MRNPLRSSESGSVDIASYSRCPNLIEGLDVYLVVKSCDQKARRKRLIDSKSRGTIGRISARPVATGLLVRAQVRNAKTINSSSTVTTAAFREPRDLLQLPDGRRYLTEIGRVVQLGANDEVVREFTHPFFRFFAFTQLGARWAALPGRVRRL